MFYSISPIHWKAMPFGKILLPFIPGLYIGIKNPNQTSIYPLLTLTLGTLLISSLIRLNNKRKPILNFLLFISILSIGYTIPGIRVNNNFRQESLNSKGLSGQIIQISEKEKTKGLTVKVDFIQDENGNINPTNGKTKIYIPKAEKVETGDRIIIRRKPDTIQKPRNPQAFNYQEYLADKGIFHQTFLRENEYSILKNERKNLSIYIAKFREKLVDKLKNTFGDGDTFSILAAMTIGYRDDMDPTLRNQFSRSGLMHILAVSGLHIGIVYILFSKIIFLFKSSDPRIKGVQAILLFVGIWFYILLTEAPPSAVRAGFLCSFLILSKFLKRSNRIYNSLAATAILLLIYNPNWISDIGFQLSFSAVWGILFFQPSIFACWTAPNKVLHYIWQLTSTSIAAQLTTLPICLFYFHQFPIYFWLSGLIGLPLAPVILGLGLLFLLLDMSFPALGQLVAFILKHILHFLEWSITQVNLLPGSNWGRELAFSESAFYVLWIIIFSLAVYRQTRHWFWLYSLLLLLFFFPNSKAIKESRILTFYHSRDVVNIDLFSKGRGLHLTNAFDQDQQDLHYIVSAWRQHYGLKSRFIQTAEISASLSGEDYLLEDGVLVLPGLSIALLNKAPMIQENCRFKPDVLFVYGRAYYPPADSRKLAPAILILDRSISRKQANSWENWAKKAGIECHNIYQKGATWIEVDKSGFYIFDLENT
ncbi:MAG: ComEC family competence protein [Bacteroidetes bacterium]|nr:ComEC family competence protein [Bacteroidota bacterium]